MPATATKTKGTTFITRVANQELVLDPEDHERNHRGQKIRQLPRTAIQFAQSRAEITEDDEGVAHVNGKPVKGRTAEELIEYVRSHRFFGTRIWELGNAPDEPKPTISEQMNAIANAAARRDVEAISEVVDVEQETHKREAVFEAAKAALEGLSEGDEPEEEEPSPSPSSKQPSTTSTD